MKMLNCEAIGHEIMTGKPFREIIAIPFSLDKEQRKKEYMKEGILLTDINVISVFHMTENLL